MEDAISSLVELQSSLTRRHELYVANTATTRPDEGDLQMKDSSMKKNQALLRKLKQITDDSKQSILQDMAKINQSKYVAEAAGAIAESPLKLKDLDAAISICSTLHQRYQDFASELTIALGKIFTPLPDDGDKQTLVRKRTTLRLLVELISVGVIASHSLLVDILKQIASTAFRGSADPSPSLSLFAAFARSGRECILGLPFTPPIAVPDDIVDKAAAGDEAALKLAALIDTCQQQVDNHRVLSEQAREHLKKLVNQYFEAASTSLVDAHAALVETEEANERVLNNRGDLPEATAAAYEAQRTAFEALQRGVGTLADILDRPLPELKATVTRVATEVTIIDTHQSLVDPDNLANSLFDDEDSRAFYEVLPNLREVVPAVLLGKTAETGGGEVASQDAGSSSIAAAKEGEEEANATEDATDQQTKELADDKKETPTTTSTITKELSALNLVEEELSASDLATTAAEEETKRGAIEAVLKRLPSAVSRELCDELAVEFCYAGGASRGARKRMAKALSDPPAGALQLLPHYARIAAVLASVFPDISATVVANTEYTVIDLSKKKDATNRTLEPRLRCSRYIAELVKFKLFPVGTAFSLLKLLLDDFTGHNVDAACAFVESAGQYLSRRPDTSTRMNNMLEVMMRLKNVRNLDARQAGLVDAAYFTVKFVGDKAPAKERPPTHEFIRYLVYDKLEPGSVPFVLKKLRRLPWAEHALYIRQILLRAVRKGRHVQLPAIASLVAGLARYHPTLAVEIIDATLEDILAGMESSDAGMYQTRVASVKFLGELYAYKLVSPMVLFSTLSLLISFGHDPGTAPETSKQLDPPGNFFRIRLVCALLDTCATYVSKGAPRKRLEAFLPYLQMYILSKPPLPLDVDLDVQEMYTRLKLKPVAYETFEEAKAAVTKIEAQRQAERTSGLQPIDEDDVELEEEGNEEEDGRSESGSESSGESSDGDAAESGEQGEEESDDIDEDSSSSESGSESSSSSDEDLALEIIPRRPRTAEDDAFERELAAVLGETTLNSSSSSFAAISGSTASIAGAASSKLASSGGPTQSAAAETVAFHVMVRRAGRDDRSKDVVNIPVSAGVAKHLKEKEQREAAERAELKRLVLEADRRGEEDASNANQGRRKYTPVFSTGGYRKRHD